MKKIRIIGAGFAGLAVGWHLQTLFGDSLKITYYDPHLGTGGASGIAAGLLHKFGSLDAKKPPLADEAFPLALSLIEEAARHTSPILRKGVVRLALNPRQEKSFAKACVKNPQEAYYLSKEETAILEPALFPAPSLFIPEALAIDSPLYLDGLIQAMKQKGAEFIEDKFFLNEKEALHSPTIIACGSGILSYPFAKTLPIKPLKGQLLIFPWPENHPPLKYAVNSKIYAVPSSFRRVVVGSTFEKETSDSSSDIEVAKEKILPSLFETIPLLKGIEPIACAAAIRITSENHQPIAKKIGENLWYFGALGSKGLLFHAYYGKLLAEQIYLEAASSFT